MSTGVYVAVILVLWLAVGLGAALFLNRRGYRDPSWYLLGAALGPLFVPIAVERGRRQDRVVERRASTGEGALPDDGTVTVLIGVDGSEESDRAVREGARLFAGRPARIVLATAIDPDIVEFDHQTERSRCRELLAERAAWFERPPEPVLEIASGQPGHVLLDVAEAEGADVVLVGRRGRGLSHRLMGSVAEYVTDHAKVPVLLASPLPQQRRHAGRSTGPGQHA